MRLRPQDIHQQTFRTSFRGFEPVEVDGFLNRVADEIERLIEERTNLEAELTREKALRAQMDEAMAAARHMQESIIERAKEDARVTLNQAKLLADRLVAEAGDEVASLRHEIRRLHEHRAEALSDLRVMAERLRHWVDAMEKSPPPPLTEIPLPSRPSSGEQMADELISSIFPLSRDEGEPSPVETVEFSPEASDDAVGVGNTQEELLLEPKF